MNKGKGRDGAVKFGTIRDCTHVPSPLLRENDKYSIPYHMSERNTIYERHYLKAAEWLRGVCTSLNVSCGEFLFAISFLVNFILGKLLHVFSEDDEVYNYYNNKGNFFNQIFVKRGWGWSSAILVVFLVLQFWKEQQPKHVAKAKLSLSTTTAIVLRWAVATLWWVLFTQWCFGIPIMDKLFVHTGGKCALIPEQSVAAFVTRGQGQRLLFKRIEDFYETRSISSYKCRKLNGSWEGGHDPLGHVFLLVHSSLFLFQEIKPFWDGWTASALSVRSIVNHPSFSVPAKLLLVVKTVPCLVVMALIALWWFMLLVTNMYFHSLAEKLVGLIFGFAGVAAVYYATRWRRLTI